jgi:hypothetical protein
LVVVFEEISFGGLSEHSVTVVKLGFLDSKGHFGAVVVLELQEVSLELVNVKTFALVSSELNSELLEFANFVIDGSILGFLGLSSDQVDTLN